MLRKLVFAIGVLVAAGLMTPVAFAQDEEPQAEFTGRLEVTEVLLDVVVTDKAGNIIIGLQPEDFIIEDGEREVNANSATFYSNRQIVQTGVAARSMGVEPEEVPSDRYFIFFFHDQRAEDSSLFSPMLDAIRWAKDWVRFEALENDWVAVLSYDFTLKVHQDFTNSRDDLLRALDSASKAKNIGSNWPSRVADEPGPSLRRNLPSGKEFKKKTIRIYSALETVADAAGPIIGRKNLLLFSMGFGKFNEVGTYIPDERYYPGMMETLNDNNMAVYSISWIRNNVEENAGQEILANSLSLVSDDTGGIYYQNFVNFKIPLQKVAEDNNGYYLLSYEAEYVSGDQGYREVAVKTRNPNFIVRARKGYKYGV